MNKVSFIVFILIIQFFIGCSHSLTVTNEDEYYASSPMISKENLELGILPPQTLEEERLVEEIIDNLRSNGNIKVKYPYSMGSGHSVDYLVDFRIQRENKGSPMNFFISFPGYIIFTPWWNGYKYSTDIMTKVNFFDFKTSEVLLNRSFETLYECKHSEFDRTWTQGLDWILTYGIASLIGGLYYTSYDDDISTEFNKKIAPNYGKYISRKLMSSINGL